MGGGSLGVVFFCCRVQIVESTTSTMLCVLEKTSQGKEGYKGRWFYMGSLIGRVSYKNLTEA